MLIAAIEAQDAIHLNQGAIPAGILAAGYDTGSGGIRWTAADYAAHARPYPAIHIDQDPGATDTTADVLDVESGAATITEIPGWVTRARAKFKAAARPGQRWPAVYCAMGNLNAAIAALEHAGIAGVGFWTAQPGHDLVFAHNRVATATGPYPCIGVQYAWGNKVDYNLFSLPWITTVSGPPTPPGSPVWPAGVTLKLGSAGDAVKVLQQALHDSGQYGARGLEPVDGVFGPKTETAVRNYQADMHLTVDGIAGPQTRTALLG